MKRIIAHLQENWIKYGFETLVVTVGILAAFGLNNWNENRKQRQKEVQFLHQLVDELKGDLYQVQVAKEGSKQSNQSASTIVYALEEDIPISDTLLNHFGPAVSPFMFRYNTATYENLKSNGFNVISDEGLRLKILQIYQEYEWFKEMMELFNQEYFSTINVQQQQHLYAGLGNHPRDYESLKNNFVFINTLRDMSALYYGTSIWLDNMESSIEELLQAIDEEIARLEG